MRDDAFGERRSRGQPAWVDASTDSWAAVAPGQRHPSESVPEPPPGRAAPDKARGHVYASSARGATRGREADAPARSPGEGGRPGPQDARHPGRASSIPATNGRSPTRGAAPGHGDRPRLPESDHPDMRPSMPPGGYRLPVPAQPGGRPPGEDRTYSQPGRPAGPPPAWFSGIDAPPTGLPIVAAGPSAPGTTATRPARHPDTGRSEARRPARHAARDEVPGDRVDRRPPTASTGTLIGPPAPTSPGSAARTSPAVSAPPATGAPRAPSAPAAEPDALGSPNAVASPDTVLPVPGIAAGAATALRAPTMLTPIVRPRSRPDTADAGDTEPPTSTMRSAAAERVEPSEVVEPAQQDPEQLLAAYDWRFHHETLRELVEDPDELRAIRDRLTEKVTPATDNGVRARLLSLRAVVSRILGDLGKALADGKLALVHAEATGQLRRIAIAQARLAHVLQWRGEFEEADRLFELANSSELPDRLRATMHEHAGRSCYDQGRYMEACNHFERALELRKVEDPGLIARTELALDAVFRKVAENGWGPYPRSREEILQLHRAPVPTFNERVQRWGYHGPDGEVAVAPSYADVQPFRDGVAWVRRPEVEAWELIDESGGLLIPATTGYLGVSSFSDGLAWVSRDGAGAWNAIDKTNRVTISTGYDDVRPFRRGIAAVRRSGRWGAVDRVGRVVVPLVYDAFVTALTDGRYVDGFTDEGLAIVDDDGRKGVVDRAGKVIVPPAHPAIVIHPVAFLVAGANGQWGALDRRGEPLIDPVHPSRTVVIDEIDRLLADTKPVL